MAADKFDLLGPALAKIGEEAMRIVGGEPDGVYLYVEIGEGWVGPSLFKEEKDQVSYIDSHEWEMSRAIMAAWCLEPEDKRWTSMDYTINGGKFDVKFGFDELDGADIDDRRDRILYARYGHKPIVYPPMPGGAELKPPS